MLLERHLACAVLHVLFVGFQLSPITGGLVARIDGGVDLPFCQHTNKVLLDRLEQCFLVVVEGGWVLAMTII